MDRETLYLDNDEEITSVVDKLKSTDTSALDIVIPKDALLLQSVVNLKILKKQAEGLSKDITIVTQDKVGRKLAEQIGIPVVDKPGEEPKVVNMSEAEPKVSEKDIEIKGGKPEEVEEEEEPVEFKEDAIVSPTREVVKPGADKANEEVDVPEEPSDKIVPPGKKKRNWKLIGIIGGFFGLALIVFLYIFIPLATVNIKLAAEKKKVDMAFTVDKKNTQVDTGNLTIPAREISEDKETTGKYLATGKKKIGTNSTGTVTVYNEYYNPGFTLIAGSRIVSSGNLVFKTTVNVFVPAYLTPMGDPPQIGQVNVNVVADQVGEQYNVAVGTFSIPSINNVKVYAKSTSAFAGGTSKDITFVSQEDINKAKEEAAKGAETELKRLALEKTERDERLLDNAVKITTISAEPSVAVNGEATEFTLVVKSNIKAIVFKEDDLKKLAESTLAEQIGSTKEIVEKEALLASTEFTDADFDTGIMHARLAGEAFIAARLDQTKIKTDLSGESEAKALDYLKNIDGIDEAEVKFFPSFYKRVPRLNSHIYLKVSLSKVQE
jgi:hypothetical protein